MLPYAKQKSEKTRKQMLSFGGLDLSVAAAEGTLEDAKNISSVCYPYLSVREDRTFVQALTDGSTLGSYNGLYYIDGTDFYYNGKIRGTVTAGKKQTTVIGNRIVIFPDKLCYNIREDTMEPLEVSFSYTLPDAEGKLAFTEKTITYTAEDGFSFVQMGFRVGDGITVDGFYTGEEEDAAPEGTFYGENNQTLVLRAVTDHELTFSDYSFLPVTPTAAAGKVITISREVPDLEVIAEWNNRLWGAAGNTIYASKPGEPDNFFVYEGLASDGYAALVGTGGAFTACCVLGSCLLFFKEDGVHTVYGTRPQSFRVSYKPMPGVAKGCEKSLTMLTEGIFYCAKDGPYLYNGALASFIGKALGENRYTDVCAQGDGRLIYAAMTDPCGERRLYTYNTQNGMWLMEDDLPVVAMCRDGGKVYFLTQKALYMAGCGEGRVPFAMVFNPMHEDTALHKRYFRLWLRWDIPENAYVRTKISIDDAPYVDCGAIHEAGSHLLPLHLPPCHSIRLCFEGEGACLLREISRQYTEF